MIYTDHLAVSDSGIVSLLPDGGDLGALDDIDLCPAEYLAEWQELIGRVLADDCLSHMSHAVWSELVDLAYGTRPAILPFDVAAASGFPAWVAGGPA